MTGRILALVGCAVLACLTVSSLGQPGDGKKDEQTDNQHGPTIKDVYKNHFLIGMAGDIPGNYSDEERAKRGIKRFPTALNEAIDALEQDKVLTGALGDLLTRSYVAVKRLEYDTFSRNDDTFETKHHFWKF